jgi:murein DD-endopeptidase MepM/ murein hydrolase activator NlpD
MSETMRALVGPCRSRVPGRLALIVLIAGGLGACASDTTRFRDSPLFNLSTSSVPGNPSARSNGIRPGSPIPPGQRLVIPRYKHGAGTHTAANAPTGPARAGVHVVVAGDSLSSLAQLYHRPRTAIAKANGIAPKTKIRIGQRLIIPSARPSIAGVPAKQTRPVAQGGHRASKVKAAAKPPVPPAGPGEVATNDPPASADRTTPTEPAIESEGGPAGGEPAAGTQSFRWPVRGRIIAGFGPRPNGPPNDGINLAVPEGTSVKAAEDGVVAYAGSELKSYGNMVLVRHYNGYVTAYAHASELMVKRGDQVQRGQIIARAGQTGSVSVPQLHFEVRKGKVPLDPTQFLPSI